MTVLNDIPFTIPPYFALLGRAIVTLEGIALTGDPEYAIIRQSYPFVARKLMREGRPEIQKALQQVLYSKGGSGNAGFKMTRLLALLNNAAGEVAAQDGAAFVDIDQVPENGISLASGVKYLLSDNAEGLRGLLEKEVDSVVDVLSRQVFRRAATDAMIALTPPRPPALPFIGDIFPPTPAFDQVPLPVLLPSFNPDGSIGIPSVGVLSLRELIDVVAPKLDQDEEVFAISLGEGATEFFGDEIGDLVKGNNIFTPDTIQVVLKVLRSGAFSGNDFVNSDSAKSALRFIGNTLNAVRSRRRASDALTDDSGLTAAFDSLSPLERERFEQISQQVAGRALERLAKRLAVVPSFSR